ncbi:MAG: hypothetical protein KatS3mg068_2209 [Candidatus Sericytochromatia bacterium]|nr:MAG: hypothetical protein KatS3mg068_2209 [Candidatus Sericytochromatia bacterium]
MKNYKVIRTKKLSSINLILLIFTIIFSLNIFKLSLVNFNLYKSKLYLEHYYNSLLKENKNLKKTNIILSIQ